MSRSTLEVELSERPERLSPAMESLRSASAPPHWDGATSHVGSDAAEPEEESSDDEGSTRRLIALICGVIFPFIQLHHKIDRCAPLRVHSVEQAFCGLGFLWALACFAFIYMFLTVSSRASCTDVSVFHPKSPNYGDHMHIVLFVKQLVQVYLMHRMCGRLTCRIEEEADPRFQHIDLRGPEGFLLSVRRVYRKMTFRPIKDRWLSTFVADHVLLIISGSGYILYQVCMAHQKVISPNAAGCLSETARGMVVPRIIVDTYMALNVMGFLCRVLEHRVRPRPQEEFHFVHSLTCFLCLWATEFLVVMLNRFIFTSAWSISKVGVFCRASSAAAQIFITHSSVMIFAVILGHSSHFNRSPDISWRTMGFLVLVMIAVLMIQVYGGSRRFHRLHPECAGWQYSLIVETWPFFTMLFRSLGGLALLVGTFVGPKPPAHEGKAITPSMIVSELLDYDLALVIIVTALGTTWDVVEIYESSHTGFSNFVGAVGGMLGPLGLSMATLSLWVNPKRLLLPGHRWLAWFALFFAMSWFVIFQEMEDCEISSDAPYCCNVPWLATTEEKAAMCDLDERCRHGTESTGFCVMSHGHGHGGHGHGGHSGHGGHHPPPRDSMPSSEYCGETMVRRYNEWLTTRAQGEFIEHEHSMPLALVLFKQFGVAASIEMYFTIIGVLLKVVILTSDERSPEILKLNEESHHHGSGHGGHGGHGDHGEHHHHSAEQPQCEPQQGQ